MAARLGLLLALLVLPVLLPVGWATLPRLAHAATTASAATTVSAANAAAHAAPPTAADVASAPTGAYRFRQAPRSGLLQPPDHLLDAAEADFLKRLPVLRVGLNLPDNRPYEVIGPDGEISGIQVELLTHVAQVLGLRLVPVVLPSFPQALQALRERRVDLMTTVGYEPSREAYMRFTLGTAPNPGAIIGRSVDARFADQPSLNNQRVAIERGYVAEYYLKRHYPQAQLSSHANTASALRAVAQGQDDYYLGSLLMATDRIQREHLQGLAVKRALVYATGQMHFGVRSDWPLLASALSKGIAAMRTQPLPALQQALTGLGDLGTDLPQPLPLAPAEQRTAAARSVLRVGAVRGLRLLNEALPDGGHSGIAADYLAQVTTRLGLAVQVVPFDTVAQMLRALREQRIHLVPFLTRTPQRERDFAFSQPYLEMPYMLVARSDAPLFWGLSSLHGRRLALAQEHPLRELLGRLHPEIRIVDARHGDDAIDKVLRGEADAAVEVKLFANLRINADSGARLRAVAPVDELPAQFHLAVARAQAPLVALLDHALSDIPGAERDRMLRRWVAVDLIPPLPWRRWLPWLVTLGGLLLGGLAVTLVWMRRLQREIRQRREAEQRLRELTDSLPGVVFQYIVDAQGRLRRRFYSRGLAQFLGEEVARSRSVFDALVDGCPPQEVQRLRDARRHSQRTLQPFKQTTRFHDPRLGERWIHCEAVAHPLPHGAVSWVGYLVDVSTERRLQNQLLDAVQAKNLFVASASHELRAPLQVISLALHNLSRGQLDEAQRQIWRVGQDACDALLQLIDDLLDLTRLESGRLKLQAVPLALTPLLQQIVQQHQLEAQQRGLTLRLELSNTLPERLLLDGLRLRQLLANLIGNALKYTPQGEVVLSADLGPDGQTLQLAVRDTGIGIAPERQHALFEPFETLHERQPGTTEPERSTGLGLAICKRLVDAMGGRIQLCSNPGEGTTVRLQLPLAALPTEAQAAQSRLLLVDDDEVSRLLMATMLRNDGYEVDEAANSAAALQRWRERRPAAVISDRHMPGGDGMELLQAIVDEARRLGAELPRRVLCTGDAQAPYLLRGQADAVLLKPVPLPLLRQTLSALGVPVPEPA